MCELKFVFFNFFSFTQVLQMLETCFGPVVASLHSFFLYFLYLVKFFLFIFALFIAKNHFVYWNVLFDLLHSWKQFLSRYLFLLCMIYRYFFVSNIFNSWCAFVPDILNVYLLLSLPTNGTFNIEITTRKPFFFENMIYLQ